MLTHSQIWAAIDGLAARLDVSVSALAKRAGLDPTTFNRSKRFNPDGQARWPSTESSAKVLSASGVSVDTFLALRGETAARHLPLRGLADLPAAAFSGDGRPIGEGWDRAPFPPEGSEAAAFVIEIEGDAFEPVFRDGARLGFAAGGARRGDRVLLIPDSGPAKLGILIRAGDLQVRIRTLPDGKESDVPANSLRSIARLIWATL